MTLRFLPKTFCVVILVAVLVSLPVYGIAQSAETGSKASSSSAGFSAAVTAEVVNPDELLSNGKDGKVKDPKAIAARVLAQPEYRDSGQTVQRNWFAKSSENVGNAISELLRNLFGKAQAPNLSATKGPFDVLTIFVWIVIAGAILAFLAWAISQFSPGAKRIRRRSVGGLLDDDEPERTADEWLVQADDLAAAGRFRESVRCLYVACLVRLDEAGVARLVRSETNWEHLRRIEDSPRCPVGLDFRIPTQKFDVIWYGYRTDGQPDVDEFRRVYTELCRKLDIKAAA